MRKSTFTFITLAILLAGFALRLALHDYHGLEGDDGFSLAVSREPLERLIPGLMRLELDIHPPLHFVALKGWTALGGDSLLSLRLMNILADMLTGALLMRLAGRIWGRRAALAAGLLWIPAPLLIYATYLIRMYTLEATLVTAGAVCVIELLRARASEIGWALALGICTLATLYTHITGVIAAAAFGLALLAGLLVWRNWGKALMGLGALFAAGILFLPFALPVLELYRSGRTLGAEINTSRFTSPLEVPATLLNTLLLHRVSLGVLLVVVLAAASLLVLLRWRGRAVPLLALAWGGVLGMMALAAFANLYKPRYLAPFVPPVLVVFGGAAALLIERMRRQWGKGGTVAAAGLLLALVGISAWSVTADLERTTRDDWVAAARFIEAHEHPGDAVIVIPDWGQEAFKFHYAGGAEVTGVFSRVSADVDIAPTLEALVEGHEGVWLVRYQPEVSDADNRAGGWLRERAATVTEVFPAGMHLSYYDFRPQHDSLPQTARSLDAAFGGALALRGVELPVTRGSAQDTRLHPPSTWVHVVLYWESLQAGTNVVPRVRFTSPFAEVYGAALERDNGVLVRNPISTWQPGQVWRVGYDLNLNPQTPPGIYNIEVMVLDPVTGEPLPAVGADAGEFWVIAGQFEVTH